MVGGSAVTSEADIFASDTSKIGHLTPKQDRCVNRAMCTNLTFFIFTPSKKDQV